MGEWKSVFPSAADLKSAAEFYRIFLLSKARANHIPIELYKLRRLADECGCENAAAGSREELYEAIAAKIGWDGLGHQCKDVGIMAKEFASIGISTKKLRELVASGDIRIVGSYRYERTLGSKFRYNQSPLYSADDYFRIKAEKEKEAKMC